MFAQTDRGIADRVFTRKVAAGALGKPLLGSHTQRSYAVGPAQTSVGNILLAAVILSAFSPRI